MAGIDDPGSDYTHDQRREHFLKTLARSMSIFGMTTTDSPDTDAAVAHYCKVVDKKAVDRVNEMHPNADSILWIYGMRYGRYLVYPFELRNAIRVAFGFCPGPDTVYSPTNKPKVIETFQLKITLLAGGVFRYWDSRKKKTSFTAMRDEEEEFLANISRLMFANNMVEAQKLLDKFKLRLLFLKKD